MSNLIDVAQCPNCGSDLDAAYTCEQGHTFAIVDGVPVLISGFDQAAASISGSFGREWAYFRHGVDRTWSQTVDERRGDFLRHVALDSGDLDGKRVLDAGCGNGMLSAAVGEFGCEVYACDLSPSVHHAARYFKESPVTFLQANLMQHPFKSEAFDVVYCAGVLHHTPDTQSTFNQVAKTVAPDGRLFVWLYHQMPQRKQRVRTKLRSGVARLPEPVRHGVAVGFAAKKTAVGTLTGRGELNWQETLIGTHDFWTPRYRWEHTPEQLSGWFSDLGFTDVQVTEVGVNGFGAVAVRA
jgi:ubiquinone/menaquinone biosynthesis C-methylase UbiE